MEKQLRCKERVISRSLFSSLCLYSSKVVSVLSLSLLSFCSKVEEAMMVLEDDSPLEAASTPSTPRNLSAWNITIPYIDFYDDDVKRERIPVFCIDVERNDRKAGEGGHSALQLNLTLFNKNSSLCKDMIKF